MDGVRDMYAFLPGDVIEPYGAPFIKVLNHKEREFRCHACFKVGAFFGRCTSCKAVLYCGKECQKSDWKNGHSLECKSEFFKCPILMMGKYKVDFDLTLRILRTVSFLHLHPEKTFIPVEMYDGSLKSFRDILYLNSGFSLHKIFLDFLKFLADKMNDNEIFKVTRMNSDGILRIAVVWLVYGFQLSDDSVPQRPNIGAALYIQPTFFPHACRPNAVRVFSFPGFEMEVRCIHAILKGERPVVSYLAENRNPIDRQGILKSVFNITCRCDLCEVENTEPSTDYHAFHIERSKLLTQPYMTSWIKISEHLTKMRCYFRNLYHEYDERFTNHYITTFHLLTNYYKQIGISVAVPKEALVAYLKETEKRIRITFGTSHQEYRKFLEQVEEFRVRLDIQF